MEARPIAIALVMHFTVLHSTIAIFHFTIGLRYVLPVVQAVYEESNFNFAASVPHDLTLTFMLMYIAYKSDPEPSLTAAFVDLIIPTIVTTLLSELRVLFLFSILPHVRVHWYVHHTLLRHSLCKCLCPVCCNWVVLRSKK